MLTQASSRPECPMWLHIHTTPLYQPNSIFASRGCLVSSRIIAKQLVAGSPPPKVCVTPATIDRRQGMPSKFLSMKHIQSFGTIPIGFQTHGIMNHLCAKHWQDRIYPNGINSRRLGFRKIKPQGPFIREKCSLSKSKLRRNKLKATRLTQTATEELYPNYCISVVSMHHPR